MFKRDVKTISELLQQVLRHDGFETPLLQKLLIDSCEVVAVPTVARYTTEKFIKNQTLYVKITNPALRQDLSMMRAQLVLRLNRQVGSQIITDIKLF